MARLKNSERNWSETCSVKRNDRDNPRSKFFKPSLRMIFRPALPNVPAALISQAGLSPERQFLRVPFGSNVYVLNQRSGLRCGRRHYPMIFWRSFFAGAAVLLSTCLEQD